MHLLQCAIVGVHGDYSLRLIGIFIIVEEIVASLAIWGTGFVVLQNEALVIVWREV